MSEVKDLRLTLNWYQDKLNQQATLLEEFELKTHSYQEKERKREAELVQSLRKEVSKLETKLVETGDRLKTAYAEVMITIVSVSQSVYTLLVGLVIIVIVNMTIHLGTFLQ